MIKTLKPEDLWQPKVGAPFKNQNALKHGRRSAEAQTLQKRVRTCLRTAKSAIHHVHKALPKAKGGRPKKPK